MRSKTTRRIRELLAALPEPVRRQAAQAYQLWRVNPFHPSLQFKRVGERDPTIYSARVGLRYRAIGVWTENDVVWVWIDSHAEYDRLIERY